MKRVTFIVSRFLDGGTENVLLQYVNNLDRERYRVSLIIANNYEGLEVHKADLAPDVAVKYLAKDGLLTRIAKKKVYNKLNLGEKIVEAIFLTPVRRLIQKRRMRQFTAGEDLVVDMDCMHHSFLRGVKAPCVAFFHFSISNYCGGKASRIKRLGKKFASYSKIVLVSKAMGQEAAQLYPTLRDRLTTIYNPQNEAALRTRAQAFAVDADNYFVTVARLEETQKDYTTLLRAYKQAVEATNGNIAELRIIGKGADGERLKALAAELGVAEKVIFMGHMSNPMPWVAGSKAFVLSSKFEGLGVVLVEAMFLGKPLIATDCPVGPREVLNNGNCGILVPVGDVGAMAKALMNVDADAALRERLTEAGREHAVNFAWQRSAQEFDALCEEVCAGKTCKS